MPAAGGGGGGGGCDDDGVVRTKGESWKIASPIHALCIILIVLFKEAFARAYKRLT